MIALHQLSDIFSDVADQCDITDSIAFEREVFDPAVRNWLRGNHKRAGIRRKREYGLNQHTIDSNIKLDLLCQYLTRRGWSELRKYMMHELVTTS